MEQGGRERVENVAQAVARTKDHSPAEADAFDHAGTREGRQHAGPNERRLAAAAHAEHEEKGPPRFRLALEAIDHFADRLGAAEEDRFVLEVELLQAAEGRSVQPGWRQGDAGFRRDARGRQAAIDQLAEVVFDVLLEIVGAFEGVKRGDQAPSWFVNHFSKKVSRASIWPRASVRRCLSLRSANGFAVLR